MLAYVLAFVATIAVGVIWTLLFGPPPTIALVAIGFVTFALAGAWNQYRRHAARGPAVAPPVLTPGTSPAGPLNTTVEDAEHFQRTFASDRFAGTVSGGRLMLTPEELSRAAQSPRAFANVVQFVVPASSPGDPNPDQWFLALGPGSGVFFNRSASQVWSVTPETLEVPDIGTSRMIPVWSMPVVHSIDGRKQKVHVTHWHRIPLCAWKADSYEEYLRHAGIWPNGWGLWAYETVAGEGLAPVLGWRHPHQDLPTALRRLSDDPKTLRQLLWEVYRGPQDVVGVLQVKTNVDYLTERLRERGIPEDHTFFAEVRKFEAEKKLRDRLLIAGLVVLLLGLGAVLAYMFVNVK
jgi:hypothetical protein